MEQVLTEIARTRRERIRHEGHALGITLPAERQGAVVPFGRDPFVICEIKRRSPSRGAIAEQLDPVAQAARYVEAGVRSISVLTEEDNFGGSLEDLLRVKEAFPDVAVLRKDFLLDEEDIDVSWRAGADAVLLIAALLPPGRLAALHAHARARGLTALVEVHSRGEIEAIRPIAPSLVGINSRDLATFHVDRLLPVKLRPFIDWDCRTVFESGINSGADVSLAMNAGYDGVLVGEAVVRRPALIGEIIEAQRNPGDAGKFWARLFAARQSESRLPLVKICGLTNAADVNAADALGANLLGFVFAESPRRADVALLRSLGATGAQKIGVVVLNRGATDLDPRIVDLLAAGHLDALQLHGDESPEASAALGIPYYKALRLRTADDASLTARFDSPRVLVDAFSAAARGGTGKVLSADLLASAAAAGPLWIAGGLGADNVREITQTYRPELVDVSSRLEAEPGRKDHAKMKSFFSEVSSASFEDRSIS